MSSHREDLGVTFSAVKGKAQHHGREVYLVGWDLAGSVCSVEILQPAHSGKQS